MAPRFFLAALLAAVLVLPACDSAGGDTSDVTGTLTNAFARPLEGGTVTLAAAGESRPACTATSDADGDFACRVPDGDYTLTATVPGYAPQTVAVTVAGETAVTVPALAGLGSIDATLVNALTGAQIASAAVSCRRQIAGDTYSAPEFTATSTAAARLAVQSVFTGEARCEVVAAGTTIPLQISIAPTTTGTVSATPLPPAGQYRIVLTWGEAPRDLDSHLTGPDGAGGRFHVYYANETSGQTNLDVDDTSSFGPETITVVPAANGLYRYSVHNFSTQSGAGAAGIASSPATVRVFGAQGLLRTYTAPAPTAANGGQSANTWKVFEMTVSGSAATFTGDVPAGIGYVTAASAGDAGSFRTGAAPADFTAEAFKR